MSLKDDKNTKKVPAIKGSDTKKNKKLESEKLSHDKELRRKPHENLK